MECGGRSKMEPRMLDMLAQIARDDAGINELFRARTRRDVVSVLDKYGFHVTDADLDRIMEQFCEENGELGETALEMVSGGNTSHAWKTFSVILPVLLRKR